MTHPNTTTAVKKYRAHRCFSEHRSTYTWAKCAIPRAVWVQGDGPYALIAWCKVPSVTLWHTYEEALKSKRLIDNDACGSRCRNDHEIAYIDLKNQEGVLK